MRKTILLLSLVLASAAAAEDAPGAADFTANCGRCHRDPKALIQSSAYADGADATQTLDAFLQHHKGAGDPDMRASIVGYLLGLR